jgi:hypothetical protein
MPFDHTPPMEAQRAPDWRLPAIADVQIRSERFAPRAPRNFSQVPVEVEDAVAITVTFEQPVPVRAMSPVLWVGGERLTESEAVGSDGRTLRFWALDRAGLREGAGIEVAWLNEPAPAARESASRFTYRAPAPR